MQQDDEDPELDELESVDPEETDLDELEELEDDEPAPAPRSGTMTFISGVLLGALVGAGIALLVAPERGTVMRKRLKKLARRMRDQAGEKIEDLADDAGRQIARRRRELKRRLREKI